MPSTWSALGTDAHGRNVKLHTSVPLTAVVESTHQTFMDTLGRTMLSLSAVNLNDAFRDIPLVVTYDYSSLAALRKPATVLIGILGVFMAAWLISQVDVSIGKRK